MVACVGGMVFAWLCACLSVFLLFCPPYCVLPLCASLSARLFEKTKISLSGMLLH